MRTINLILLALLLIFGIPYYWLFLEGGNRQAAPRQLAVAQLRSLAQATPGAKPRMIRFERVAARRIMKNLVVAGSGLRL